MKLNEILINKKQIKYIDNAPVGMRYAVVDESMNRVVSTHATKESAYKNIDSKNILVEKQNLFESFSFDGSNWPVGSVFQLDSQGNKWGVGLGVDNEIIEFEGSKAQSAARDFVKKLPTGQSNWTTGTIRRAARNIRTPRGVTAGIRDVDLSWRNRRAAIDSFAALENLKNTDKYVGPSLAKIISSPWWKGFSRIVSAVGIPATVVWTNIGIISDLEVEAQQNPDKAQENYELRNIIIAQTSAQVLGFLLFTFRNASLLNRALRAIKWTVRSVQGGAALTGIGAIPSALSFLITEAGWLVAAWIIQSETVQRALAEYIHDSMFSVVFELAGQGISGALTLLDAAFDGQFGTGALRASLGWESKQPDAAEEGEFASSAEWAKLVFHGLLFPPARENLLVPYIGPEQRATMLRQTLGVAEEPAATEPAPAQTNEPRMPTNPNARTGPQ